jgi:hypothetical protein
MAKYVALFALVVAVVFCSETSAQEQFDVVSFTAPKGWQKSVEQSAVQFTVREGNGEAILMLFKALPTGKDSRATFNASWDSIVKGLFDKAGSPQMQPVTDQNGWNIESGAAVVEKSGSKAVASLMSATGGGKVVNLLIITNSASFQPAIDAFIGSIKLAKVEATKVPATSAPGSTDTGLVGKIWRAYIPEKYSSNTTTGGYYTGGYQVWQYRFNPDGTYNFVHSGASALSVQPTNVLQYEAGTYSVSGGQLTISPESGSNEEWSVGSINNGMSDTHIREVLETRLRRIKSYPRKLEKITYPYKIEFWAGNNENALMLQHTRDTEREGSPGANNYSSFFVAPPGRAIPFPTQR